MILSRALHDRTADMLFARVKSGAGPLAPGAGAAEGLTYDAAHALARAAHARYIRCTAHKHRIESALKRYEAAYTDEGRTILEIADSPGVKFSPCLLARLLVERLLGVKRSTVGLLLRTPSLIPDARLRAEVAACVEADPHCSPLVDRVKEWAGAEHEWRLQAALLRGTPRGGVPRSALYTEEELRARGLRRTPDVLLRWPAVVACAHGAPTLVAWLDSKAAFCEDHAAEDAAAQAADYTRLFGPGALVFWGGYVAELARGCCEAGGPLPRGVLLAAEPPVLLRYATPAEAAALRGALAEDAGAAEGGAGLWLQEPPEQAGDAEGALGLAPLESAETGDRQAALRAAAEFL
jgi:hypothetical protein